MSTVIFPQIFAVFAVCKVGDKFCATSRENSHLLGLPGGKVDETDFDIFSALRREAREEGWDLLVTNKVVKIDYLDNGRAVAWIHCTCPQVVSNHKEKSRGIMPTLAYASQLAIDPSMKNEFLAHL